MATQEMILKLSFDDEGTFTGLSDINQELAKTDTATQALEKSTKTLKAQYADLKKQQDQMDPGTEKFNQLSQKMGELKDRMNDAAEAVKGNTGPAIEGMGNTFGIMGDQLKNLDFDGLTQSIGTFSANLGRIDPKAMMGSLKAMLAAGVQGFKALGNVIKQNPIFILVGIIIGIIAYWEELTDLVSGKSKMLEGLKQQAEVLKSQEQALTRQLALQKALGAGAAQMLRTELDMLRNKQAQAETAMKIAYAEKDREAFLEAQQSQLQAINDLELAKIKINQDAQALLTKIRAGKDDEYNKQVLQNEAFSVYKTQTERLGVLQEEINAKAKQVNNDIADAQRRGNQALVDKLQLEKQSLYNQNVSIQSDKDEIWNAGMAAKEEVKTEKELERIAASKAKQAERKSAADAAAKKLADDILAIEQRMAELQRAGMDDQEQELFTMFQRQEIEEKTFIKAKKSADELAKLRATHEAEFAALTAKYDKEAEEKEKEKKLKEEEARQKELERTDEQYQLLQKLKSDAQENEINEAVLSAEKLQELATGNPELELAIQEDLKKKLAEITKKYLDKQVEDTKKSEAEISAAKQATQDFRLKQLSESFAALGALNDAFTKKGQQQSKKQFQIQKALNLASAVVDTYGGINRALNDKTMPSTTARIIQASIVGAMGLANVIKISKTEYGNASAPSGTNMSAGGGGDEGTTAPSPANFAFLQNQPNQHPPLQAYVVGTQVSSNLEAQQLIQNQSRLGG